MQYQVALQKNDDIVCLNIVSNSREEASQLAEEKRAKDYSNYTIIDIKEAETPIVEYNGTYNILKDENEE